MATITQSATDYVLITPARDEESFIGATIESVCAQTILPLKWIIVDDGSTDGTAEIVEAYEQKHDWIELVRRPVCGDRNFAGKVHAFNAGLEHVQDLDFQIIGNLDADVLLESDHCEFLLGMFANDPSLGVAGTAYYQEGWDSTKDSFEGEESVAGPLQFFRSECFAEIGGYVPNPAGGVDWIAVTTARMKGWKTLNSPKRRFQHLRLMGTANRSRVGAMYDYGAKDYFLGRSPIWQSLRGMYRMAKKPYLIGGTALLWGYWWAAIRRVKRPVSQELIQFHRKEQLAKLRTIFGSVVRFRRVEKFSLATEKEDSQLTRR